MNGNKAIAITEHTNENHPNHLNPKQRLDIKNHIRLDMNRLKNKTKPEILCIFCSADGASKSQAISQLKKPAEKLARPCIAINTPEKIANFEVGKEYGLGTPWHLARSWLD